MKRAPLVMLCLLLLAGNVSAQNTHYYQTTFKDTGELAERSFLRIDRANDGNIALHFEKGFPEYTQQEDYLFNAQYDTISAHVVNKNAGTDYSVQRKQNSVIIKGTLDGKQLERSIAIDSNPLFLFSKFNLAGFALAQKKKKVTFWSLRNDNLNEYKMIATREGIENIFLGQSPTAAIKLYVTTVNPLFRMFKRTYYFRSNDGLFLKQEYADGRIRELVKEE